MTVELIIAGSGEAARSVAYPCREAGWNVTVVDSDPFGGTCDLRGCDPKKVLVGVSELVDWNRRMMGNGISSPVPTLRQWSGTTAPHEARLRVAAAHHERRMM